MILWREKVRAFGIHFIATLVVALIAAALIFFVWYPDPFERMVGGLRLFLLVAGCDLALGPLISLVIYNSKKSRRELVLDYVIVGLVQIAAFVYGVYMVSQARPAFVVFVGDRLEVVAAGEILEKDFAEARDPKFSAPPKLGPVFAATVVRPEEQQDALFTAMDGRDIGVRPKFFVEYATQTSQIQAKSKPLSELEQSHPDSKAHIEDALRDFKRPAVELGWLPVKHSRGFWTALIDMKTGKPAYYVAIDPY